MITAAKLSESLADPLDPQTIAVEAYIYLYPLVLVDLTRLQLTNVGRWDGKTLFAPMNTFGHFRAFPPLDFRTVVRPSFDTLYSVTWLDLSREPMIVSIPDTAGRYYVIQTLDMWSDTFASPGWRTTGTKTQHYAYCRPGWSGSLPNEVIRVDAPTPTVWIGGRIQTNGEADYQAVHRLQDGLQLTPLSQWGQTPAPVEGKVDPDVDMTTPPMKQVEQMSGEQFFQYAAELLNHHTPHRTDYSQIWRLRRLGLGPGQHFDFHRLDHAIQHALRQAPELALQRIRDAVADVGTARNGWRVFTNGVGVYGIDYLTRAAIAMLAIATNDPADAVYPQLLTDTAGEPLRGDTQYLLHFESGKLPPADAFWSISLYDHDGFPVPNVLNRVNLSSWMDLSYNADGSLDLYLQPESPGEDKAANWLPTPTRPGWNLTLRLYAPRFEALRGIWAPPAIHRTTTVTAGRMGQAVG